MIGVAVKEESQVAAARREAVASAQGQHFNESDSGRVALVTTELATNLIKHGSGGEILVGSYEDGQATGVEILALDQGRGIADVEACLRDGFSSAGTQGHGLGAIVRQSNFVDIASWPGVGTGVLARIQAGRPSETRQPTNTSFGAVSIAMPGEEVCGDSWAIEQQGQVSTLMVADGLGHGPEAAEASVEAVRLFRRYQGHQVSTLMDYIHSGLRSTRGAALSVARYDPAKREIQFAGIGNVAGAIAANGDLRRMVSMPGTAGYNVRKIQSFPYPFEGGLVILCSDGLSTTWTLERYPKLAAAHPTLIAGVLYRDLARHKDDATVLVGKWVGHA